jgi:hypothetical protein
MTLIQALNVKLKNTSSGLICTLSISPDPHFSFDVLIKSVNVFNFDLDFGLLKSALFPSVSVPFTILIPLSNAFVNANPSAGKRGYMTT